MIPTHRSSITAALALALCLPLGAGCKPGEDKNAEAEANKKAWEAAAATLKQPVANIAAFLPYVKTAEPADKYAKKHSDAMRVTTDAADEVRQAANEARQKLDKDPTKDVAAALSQVAVDCTEVKEVAAADKCYATAQKLDEALKKAEATSTAAGGPKLPHVAPESITEEAKAHLAPLLRAKGPSPAEKAYIAKRSDATATVADVSGACQAAAGEVNTISSGFEKAEEPLRLVAVTHKMAVDSDCGALTAAETVSKDLNDCRKKAKTPECKIVCGKAKALVDDGVPAAAFASLEKDVADICK